MTITLFMRRLLMFCAGFATALGSSLATMENGGQLTLSQIGQVPLLAWVLAFGSGVLAALNGAIDKTPGAAKLGAVSLVLLAMGGMMSGCGTTPVPKNVSQQIYVVKNTIADINNLITLGVNARWITPQKARAYAEKVDNVAADLKSLEMVLKTVGDVDAQTKAAAFKSILDTLIAELLAAEKRSQSP